MFKNRKFFIHIFRQQKFLYILYHCNHFDMIISPGAFFWGNGTYFCAECEKTYTERMKHNVKCKGV